MERRKFIRGAGFLGLLAAGAVGAREATAVPIVVNEHTHIHNKTPEVDPAMVARIEECEPSSITFTSKYGEIAPPPPPAPVSITSDGNLYFINGTTTGATWSTLSVSQMGGLHVSNNGYKKFVPGTEQDIALKLVPGPDGELYLNINGRWKKVLTTV